MTNPLEFILGLREEEKMVVLVDPSADKQDLPRFRPPKVKALRPTCLVLIDKVYRGIYNGEIGICDLARVVVASMSVSPSRRPSQPLSSGAGSREPLPTRVTIRNRHNSSFAWACFLRYGPSFRP